MTPNLGQIMSLIIDGTNALTVLDTTNPSPGTPDSASGADFTFTDGSIDAVATYSSVVAISPNAAVGDLYQVLTVNFGNGGPRTDFSFRQDTDNDSRFGTTVPEPGSLALVALALAAAGAGARRTRTPKPQNPVQFKFKSLFKPWSTRKHSSSPQMPKAPQAIKGILLL